MKTETTKKSSLKVTSNEQLENLRNTRKTLKDLQQTADKENLIGRARIDGKLAPEEKSETKKKKLVHKCVQTGEVTEGDLTGDEASVDYWKALAEKREASLNESFRENERLKECVDALKEENKVCKELLDESRHLVAVLQEMLDEESEEPAPEM